MPKIKSNLKSKISNWIAPYNESKEVFSSDGKIIYCLVCEKSVSTEKNIYSIIIPKQVSFVLYAHTTRNITRNSILFYFKNTCIFILVQHINALQRNKEKKTAFDYFSKFE